MAVENYAKYLGFAFQVADDLTDLSGTFQSTGKDTDKDKGNFVKAFGEAEFRKIIKRYAEKAGSELEIFKEKQKNCSP